MTYYLARNNSERKIIDKLNTLFELSTFWDDVKMFTKKIASDNRLHIWEVFAEVREAELLTGCEDVRIDVEIDDRGKFKTTYRNPRTNQEVLPIIN